MDKLYEQLVQNKQKAIVGFVFGFVATYFAKYGFDFQTLTVKELFEQLAYAVIGYVGVYLKANK